MVIQQNSGKIVMMDILMSETCWAHKKWNKIASDIKLVFYSSTILPCFFVGLIAAEGNVSFSPSNLFFLSHALTVCRLTTTIVVVPHR